MHFFVNGHLLHDLGFLRPALKPIIEHKIGVWKATGVKGAAGEKWFNEGPTFSAKNNNFSQIQHKTRRLFLNEFSIKIKLIIR